MFDKTHFYLLLLPVLLAILLFQWMPATTFYLYEGITRMFPVIGMVLFCLLVILRCRDYCFTFFLLLGGFLLTLYICAKKEFDKHRTDPTLSEIMSPVVFEVKQTNGNKLMGRVFAVENKDSMRRIALYGIVFCNDSASAFRNGDHIIIDNEVHFLSREKEMKPWNSHYLSMGYSVYTYIRNDGMYKIIDTKRSADPLGQFRFLIRRMIQKTQLSEVEKQFLLTLLLGERNGLSSDIKSQFSKSGVIHIMAVSGLHVGLIYLIFNYLLGMLRFSPWMKHPQTVLVVVLIWVYAAAVQFSPSVVRACFMLSVYQVGKMRRARTNPIDILILSFIHAIVIDPHSAQNIGFQLSHLAVLGILLMYPVLDQLIRSRFWLINKIWSLLVVSFSAQLLTMPLGLYYFGVFPNYFLIANLCIVPLVGLLLGLTMLMVVVSFSGILLGILSYITHAIISYMFLLTKFISSLPGSVNEISINRVEVLVLYTGIVLLIYLLRKGTAALQAFLLWLGLFLSYIKCQTV